MRTGLARHRKLADYFGSRPVSPRVVEERPWHLAALREWHALAQLLAEPEFLAAAWPIQRVEIRSYWEMVERETGTAMIEALAGLVENPDCHPEAAWALAKLLADSGDRTRALRLALWRIRQGGTTDRIEALDLAASLALDLGDLQAALDFSQRQALEAAAAGDVDAQVAAPGAAGGGPAPAGQPRTRRRLPRRGRDTRSRRQRPAGSARRPAGAACKVA